MKTLVVLFLFALSSFGGWGEVESEEYRYFIQNRLPESLAKLGLPVPPGAKPSVAVFVTAKDGVPSAKEHRVTIRFTGVDGRSYRQTISAIPNPAGGFFAVFDVEATSVLSVDVERVNPPVIQEAQ